MKFGVKQKSLTSILKLIKTLGDLVVGKDIVDRVDIFAEQRGLTARVHHGSLHLEYRIPDSTVDIEGATSVAISSLLPCLSLSGDRVTFVVTGANITYTAGRSKGKTVGYGAPLKPLSGRGSTVGAVQIDKLPAMLGAAALKGKNKDTKTDYTLYFTSPSTVRLDAGDDARAVLIAAVTDVEADATAVVSAQILDALRSHLEGVSVLAQGTVFTLQTPALWVQFPQSSSQPEDVVDKLSSIAQQGMLGRIIVDIKELSGALGDALGVLSDKDKSSLDVEILGNSLTLSARSGAGSLESTCDVIENEIAGMTRLAINPASLKSLLDLMSETTEAIRISIYPPVLVLDQLEAKGGISRHTALASLDAMAVVDRSVAAPQKNPPVTAAPAAPKAATTPATPAPAATPAPKPAAPAKKVDDFDEDD